MSRPRKPFGAQQPGRLQSTMMKVLAAEMSDPQRLKRGKQYAKDGSVTDIVIEPGVVTCEIQGSRSTPYVAALEVTRGDGMPLRRDVSARCTCPDDANFESHACKHVLATMFVFADELLIEPELLDVWRANQHALEVDEADHVDDEDHDDDPDDDDDDDAPDGPVRLRSVRSFDPDDEDPAEANSLRRSRLRRNPSDDPPGERDIHDDESQPWDDAAQMRGRRRHLELVREGIEQGRAERRERHARRNQDDVVDPLAPILGIPDGAELPEIVVAAPDDGLLPARSELATILRDAHRHLRLDWD